jgi:hypothetical protein
MRVEGPARVWHPEGYWVDVTLDMLAPGEAERLGLMAKVEDLGDRQLVELVLQHGATIQGHGVFFIDPMAGVAAEEFCKLRDELFRRLAERRTLLEKSHA